MGERGFAIKADGHNAKWETGDFPMLCETCLGPDPYVRMMKQTHGAACKVCSRPYTVFRWKPGRRARYKRTEICQGCSKMRNVCQTCVLDLKYGLPVEVRDAFINATAAGTAVESDANREYKVQAGEAASSAGKASRLSLAKVARKDPYYKRNKAHLCTMYAKGACTRGDECPYLHELSNTITGVGGVSVSDRYFGHTDPKKKILEDTKTKE